MRLIDKKQTKEIYPFSNNNNQATRYNKNRNKPKNSKN